MTVASVPRRRRYHLQTFWFPLTAFALAVVTAALCRFAAGVSLGLFFGGVAFATLLVPPLVAGETSLGRRLVIPALVTLGIALVWLTAVGQSIAFTQWLACSAALLAYAFAIGGLTALLSPSPQYAGERGGERGDGLRSQWKPPLPSPLPRVRGRGGAVLVPALVTVLALLWLTWPVWLSRALSSDLGETLVTWLVPAHPLFAINAVLSQFESWDRHPLAYSRLTVLNQDVFYRMPAGVLWTTVAHGVVAITATALAWRAERNRQRQLEERISSQT